MSYCVKDEYLETRKKVIDNYLKKVTHLTHIDYKKGRVERSLPVRVNFSGTWTDAMPYCLDNGGEVINMAVTVNSQKPIKIIAEKLNDKKIEFCSDDVTVDFTFDSSEDFDEFSDFNLHTAVLNVMGITKETRFDNGFRITTKVSGIDKGSGLGTSSILLGGCIKALGELIGRDYTDEEIINMVFVSEQLMKTGGGWQDQVGGLFPSVKIISTKPGLDQTPEIRYINLPDDFKKAFSQRLVLIPTGQRHYGRFIVNDVVNRYIDKNEEALGAYESIKKLNTKMLDGIKENNFEKFSDCLNEHFDLLKKISTETSNEKIDTLAKFCLENVADAVSICGAGGGGYLLAVMKKGITLEDIQKLVDKNFPNIKSNVKKPDIYE